MFPRGGSFELVPRVTDKSRAFSDALTDLQAKQYILEFCIDPIPKGENFILIYVAVQTHLIKKSGVLWWRGPESLIVASFFRSDRWSW